MPYKKINIGKMGFKFNIFPFLLLLPNVIRKKHALYLGLEIHFAKTGIIYFHTPVR